MVILRPKYLPAPSSCQAVPEFANVPGFIVHPTTSELAEQLMIDPQALNSENYSGLYDENGDYVPQYCDNPEDIPQSAPPITANTSVAPTPAASGENDSKPDSSSSQVDTTSES